MIVPDAFKKGPDFTQTTPPANPWVGCVWLNPTTNELKVFNGVDWDQIIEATESAWPFGYVCGGYADPTFHSTIDRFTFPFDSGTASHVGNVSQVSEGYGGQSSSVHGYFHGSQTSGGSYTSNIFRFQFPFDSGTATVAGYTTYSANDIGGCSSSTHGYFFGCWDPWLSTVNRYQFPLEGGSVCQAGMYLSSGRGAAGGCSSSMHGYACGGNDGSGKLSTIDRFQFPFDSGSSTNVGSLSGPHGFLASATSSSTNAYVCGGDSGSGYLSTIDRFAFPFDSGTASHVGDLSGSRYWVASCSSTENGYACGGAVYTTYHMPFSTIDRLIFPFDSGTASNVGYLSLAQSQAGACSAVDPHLRW